MVNDSMKADKFIGMVQPKISKDFNDNKLPSLHKVGCLGKITSFKEADDGRYLIDLKGVIRFEIKKEIDSNKKYREFEINFENFLDDLEEKKENLKFSDLELIFKDLKTLFEKRGFIINWKALEKQSLDETINALAMTSPFSLEEKQVLFDQDISDKCHEIPWGSEEWAESIQMYMAANFTRVIVGETKLVQNPLYYNTYCIAINCIFASLIPFVALTFFNISIVNELRAKNREVSCLNFVFST